MADDERIALIAEQLNMAVRQAKKERDNYYSEESGKLCVSSRNIFLSIIVLKEV